MLSLFSPMMKLPTGLRVFSISCFSCCFSVSCFLLINTLVSLPLSRPDQVELLLAFKNEFSSPVCDMSYPATKSWTKDAITFDGVVFDNETRVVTELHLHGACLGGSLKANSSIFRFQHLRYLDLSSNYLVGEVPSSIRNLSRLTYLDLSENELTGNFPLISNITKLAYIDFSKNHFSGTIPSSLFTMSFVTSLNLSENYLKDPLKTMNSSSSSKLKNLILSKNLFSGGILEPISKLVSLTHLDLSFNDFTSFPFPTEFGKLANLENLDLHSNGFIHDVPSSVGNLSQLTDLDLSKNKFTGSFPFVHNLTKLSSLHLSSNNFSGPIPSSLLTTPSSLSVLALTGNHLSDPIQPVNSSSLSSKLQSLILGGNLFSGQFLEVIIKLVNLTYLDLSYLNMTFPINFSFLPLKSLERLDVSGNDMSWLTSNPDSALPTELTEVRFWGCNINEFPKFLRKQWNLESLDLSRNNMKGKVPEWLWNLPYLSQVGFFDNSFDGFEGSQEALRNSSIYTIDLESNAFQGSFPTLPPGMVFVSAAFNNFTGGIPLSLCNPSLVVLKLPHNNFSGSIPACLTEVLVLNLRNNSLSGRLSFNKENLSLKVLDVGHNQIVGKLPRSLANSTFLEFLNVEANRITDTFPFWLKNFPRLQVIILRSNRFHGPISSPQDPILFNRLRMIDISHNYFTGTLPADYFVNWSAPLVNILEDYSLPDYMEYVVLYPSISLTQKGLNMTLEKILLTNTVIDFSANRFGGRIPESIGLLKQLVVLDLSNNDFIGDIPSSLAKLTKLESLDLSRNQLSGEIPQDLATLSFLGYINVSHNQLIGRIPQSAQFGGQSKSSFESNINLCGLPLQKSCFEENGSPIPKSENSNPPKEDQLLNWKAAAIGYGPGVLIGLAIGHVIYSYRPVLYYKLFRL